jgi:hypothetical protein
MNEQRDMAFTILRHLENLMWQCVNGKTKQQWIQRGQTSKLLSQWNMHARTSKTSSPRSKSKPTSLKNRQRQQKNSLQLWLRTTLTKWRHWSKAQLMLWKTWCSSERVMPPLQQIPPNLTDEEKKKKRDEKQKKYNKTPICTHCGKKLPSKKEDKCWELEKNKASHPATWKLLKSIWRCTGSSVEIEMWRPGKMISNNLKMTFTHPAVTNYWTPLYEIDNDKPTKEEEEINMT